MAPRGWGFWTEAKLDILSAYLRAFATAGSKKAAGELVYLDLFAGNASNQRRDVERDIKGSAIRALEALPDYARLFLFELDKVAAELEQELRGRFPTRQFEVVPGDSHATLQGVLGQLKVLRVDWAPTFAFVDPYSSAGLRWETLARLADFKRERKYKAELWILFYVSDIPRVLGQNPANSALLRETFGGDLWSPIARARDDGTLTAEVARREYTNVLRWRIEMDLGYRYTHSFEVRKPRAHISTTWCSPRTMTPATGSWATYTQRPRSGSSRCVPRRTSDAVWHGRARTPCSGPRRWAK